MRTFIFTALLATLALLLAVPSGALAAKPSFSHDQVDDTFDGFFCGAPAIVHFQLNGHQFIFTHSGPFPYFKGNGVTRVTWTNPIPDRRSSSSAPGPPRTSPSPTTATARSRFSASTPATPTFPAAA